MGDSEYFYCGKLHHCLGDGNYWSFGHSFTRLFTLVRTALWRRWDLASLLKSYGTASGDFRFIATPQQPCFNGF